MKNKKLTSKQKLQNLIRAEVLKIIKENNTSDDVYNDFMAEFTIQKDLGSLRKSGILQEKLINVIKESYGPFKIKKSGIDIDPIECRFAFQINTKKTVGIYSFECRSGVPTFKIGVNDMNLWKEIRTKLKELNLIR